MRGLEEKYLIAPMEQAAARHPEGWRLFHEVVSRKPSENNEENGGGGGSENVDNIKISKKK